MKMKAGCLVVVVLAMLVQEVAGTTWRVGGDKGWQLNVNFALWEQGKVFEVGDILWFSYNKSTEDVLEVSAADYSTCTTVAPIAQYTDGNTTVPLGNLTTRYFISSIPGHCVDGMALQIQMGLQAPPPAPTKSPTPAPVPSPLMPPPTPNSPPSVPPPLSQISSPPPLSSTAASSFSVLSLAILLLMVTYVMILA